MDTPIILWIELSGGSACEPLIGRLSSECRVYRLSNIDEISARIAALQPHLLCFDYDHPDQAGLNALRTTKRGFPSMPILMLTEPNSEALAVWALRTRVWDYLIKPVDLEELLQRIRIISQFSKSGKTRRRVISMPEQSVPVHIRTSENPVRHATYPAITYIQTHFPEKIMLYSVAKRCEMKPTSFSRAFKREQGQTFRDFLMQFRINKAVELLQYSSSSVLDIAFSVGFNDPSQFTRMFKRHIGSTPSEYRSNNQAVSTAHPEVIAAAKKAGGRGAEL